MVSPPPGVSSADRVPPTASARPAGDGQPEAEAAGAGVVEPLERLEHPLPLRRAGTPGPRSTTMISTVSGSTCAEHPHRRPGGDAARRCRPGWRPPARAGRRRWCTSGADSSTSSDDGARRVAGDRQRQHLVEAAGAQHRAGCSPVCSRDRSSRLSMSRSSWSVESSTARDQLARGRPRRAPPDDQPVDGGAHGRQRRAQVVGDGAQQGGRGGLGALEGGGPLVALAQPPVLQHQPGLHGERLEHPLVAGPQRLAAEREHVVVVDRGPGCRPRRGWPRTGSPDGGQHAPARRALLQQRDGVLAERLAQPLDDRLGGVLAGEHRAGQPAHASPPRRARAVASAARRDARSTTVATAAATATNTSRASRFCGSETVSVPTGGVKNQLSSEEADDRAEQRRAAARRPGRPATVRGEQRSIGQRELVGVGEQRAAPR